MTDPKPTQENMERAHRWLADALGIPFHHYDCTESLAAEFADSDAIARRRAIEEAIAIVSEAHGQNDAFVQLCALLRAPTSEKAEETKCEQCADEHSDACSPPADGGGG